MKGGNGMKIEIIGEPKEIAALVLAVQERQAQSNLVRRRVIEDSGEADHAMTAADAALKTHTLTMDEMPHHPFSL